MNTHKQVSQPAITPVGNRFRCQGSGVSVLGETPSAALKGWGVEMGRLRRKQAIRAKADKPMATQRPMLIAHKA